ncbi:MULTISPECIES: hypothetical protein [Pseudofrankia]|uniref:hypothetical protein n=1 Tax=Pseudofrankia TaxID=2994363 RepID=UPI0002E3A552|nr:MULTISPECIES: hypothetical protein [Pseudofrankia]
MTAIRSVVLVGLFSAKERDYQARLDVLDVRVTALGGNVLERFVQRRGVSDGGVRLMTAPCPAASSSARGNLTRSRRPVRAGTSTPSSSSMI